MIEMDGSFGEGGGQILRSSLALAAVLGKEVRIFNIRAGRSEPGLRAQHLTGAKAVADLCNASYRGLEIGSTEFAFRPGSIEGGDFRFNVGTAGSITLVLQALMPLLPFASGEVTLEVRGGTDVKWSPPVDYLRLVTLPLLEKMGATVSLRIVTRGHYPKGGGVVKVSSVPSGSLKSVVGLEGGRVNSIVGVSHAVKLPAHIAQRQATAAVHLIREKGLPSPVIEIQSSENSSHLGPGSGVVLAARLQNSSVVGGDCLGERGKPAEEVGRVAALALLEEIESGSFLDRHMGDMTVPYLALAEGVSDLSVSRITQHTLTNIKVAETVAGVQFDPTADLGRPSRLRVKGLGVRRGAVGASPRGPHPILGS
jgi:RNA 3'-terminal phosphate cyclase (ATP)